MEGWVYCDRKEGHIKIEISAEQGLNPRPCGCKDLTNCANLIQLRKSISNIVFIKIKIASMNV